MEHSTSIYNLRLKSRSKTRLSMTFCGTTNPTQITTSFLCKPLSLLCNHLLLPLLMRASLLTFRSMVTCLTHGLMGSCLNLRGYGGALNIFLRRHHSNNIALTRDLHCQLFKVKMEGFLEATHPKIGVKKMEIMIFGLKMINHGYSLWIIQLSLKLSKIKNIMLSETTIYY